MHRETHRYTLTEILVAVAVLMLMMTFLLQFVIGSQRIWYASTRTSSVFDKAQVVFSIMETDIKQSLFSNEKGESIPMYLDCSTDSSSTVGSHNTDVRFGVVTRMVSGDKDKGFSEFSGDSKDQSVKIVKGTVFPVLYHFDRESYRLYRLALDTTSYVVGGSQKPFVNVNQFYYGLDFSALPAASSVFAQIADKFDEEVKEVVADDLLDFSIDIVPNDKYGNNFLKERPKAVRITITLFDHEKYPNYELRSKKSSDSDKKAQEDEILPEARTFSKVIFLQ